MFYNEQHEQHTTLASELAERKKVTNGGRGKAVYP